MNDNSHRLWLHDHYVSAEVRTTLLRQYPGLKKDEGHLRLICYCAYGTWYDKDPFNSTTSRLPLLESDIWRMYPRYQGNYSIKQIISIFETDTGLNLNAIIGNYYSGKATTIDPEYHPEVQNAFQMDYEAEKEQKTIKLVSGEIKTARSQRADRKRHKEQLRQRVFDAIVGLAPDKPHTRLIERLNNQSQDHLWRLISKGLPECKALAARLPENNEAEKLTKIHTQRTLIAIENLYGSMIYFPSDKTLRISTKGSTIHQLPRLFRLLLLALSAPPSRVAEFDLKSAHWAINATRWECPMNHQYLSEQLKTGGSVWSPMLECCELTHEYKPVLKATQYALNYGMCKSGLRDMYINGDGKGHRGAGDERRWRKFSNHPLTMEMYVKREENLARSEGNYDVYGDWCENYKNGKYDAKSTESALAQSYEQKLMHAMLPILEADPRLIVLSYLHDGLTIYFSDTTEQEAQIRRIKQSVNQCAEELNIPTELEVTVLDADKLREELIKTHGIV